MTRAYAALFILCSLAAPVVASAQTYQPKAIVFKGDPEYSNAELLKASGLKQGASMTLAQMNEATKLLMDTGAFQDLTFSFNGQELAFQAAPASVFVPPQYENLPIETGAAFEERMRSHVPLYHGKLPADGTLLTAFHDELVAELKAAGIDANILTAPSNDPKTGQVAAISFTITTPEIRIGEVSVDGAATLGSGATQAANRLTGSAYSTVGSVSQVQTALTNYYGERGYLKVAVHAAPHGSLVVSPESVRVPFAATVEEGTPYKLASVKLDPAVIVSQATFDRQSELHPGNLVSLEKLRGEWAFLARQYHNQGMINARVIPEQTLDAATQTAAYTVSVVPGAVYTMGTLTVENVSDDIRAMIVHAWPVPAGQPFNEGAILSITATVGVNKQLEKFFSSVNLRYQLKPHEDNHTVDLILKLERKM